MIQKSFVRLQRLIQSTCQLRFSYWTIKGTDNAPSKEGAFCFIDILKHTPVFNMVVIMFLARLFHEVMEEDEFKNKYKLLVFAILDDHNVRLKHNPDGNFFPFVREFKL